MATTALARFKTMDQESCYPDEVARVVSRWVAKGWRWLKDSVIRGVVKKEPTPDGGLLEIPLLVLLFERIKH